MNNKVLGYFPQGVATGENFCNRHEERKRLITNIETVRPTLIMSPRRYGKTSLILFVLNQLKTIFAHIDLYAEFDENGIQNTILGAIGDILYSLEPVPKKAFKLITEFFASLSIAFTMEGTQVHVQFARVKNSPAKNILSSLKKLDDFLRSKNKTAVIFIDEFQRLAQVSKSTTIEGALRHIAQSSKNIMFVFSGSNRHLLVILFFCNIFCYHT